MLLTIGQPIKEPARFLIARAAPYHLPELDARLHWLHEYEVHDFRHVDARVQHVHRHGNARLVVLLELADEAVAIAAVMHALHAVMYDLQQADMLRVHLLEHIAHAICMILGHRKHDGLAG